MYIVATLTFDIRRGKSVKRRWGWHPLIMIVPCIQIVRWNCMFTAPKLRDIPSMPCYPQKSAGFTSEYLGGWFCGPLLSVHKSRKLLRSTFSDMPGYVLKLRVIISNIYCKFIKIELCNFCFIYSYTLVTHLMIST